METTTFVAGVAEDRETAVVELRADSRPLAQVSLDASFREDPIQKLADCQATPKDPVIPGPDPSFRIIALGTRAWQAAANTQASKDTS